MKADDKVADVGVLEACFAGAPCGSSSVISLFRQQAARFPDKTAVICDAEAVTYRDLARRAAVCSGVLKDMGVRRGSRLIVALDNGIHFSTALLAAAGMGAVLAPVSTTLGTEGVVRAIRSVAAEFLIGQGRIVSDLLENANDFPLPRERMLCVDDPVDGGRTLPADRPADPIGDEWIDPDISPEADYILTLTSGSTGTPKPIVLSQATKVKRAIWGAKELYGLSELDVIITSSPMYHSLGLRLALLPLLIGARSVILKYFTPAAWLQSVEIHRVSFAILVSAQVERLLRRIQSSPIDISSLRTIVSSSSLLKEETKRMCSTWFGCEFHECYGASEVGIVTNLSPGDGEERLGSVGRAVPYVDLRILDEQGHPAPVGQRGEIACRTPTGFSGYFRNRSATDRQCIDGFFRTGDIGYLDGHGFLYFCGRKDDMINVGGTNVFPEDVEEVIASCPGVKECAVIGVEDDYLGEAVVAVVAPDDPALDLHQIRTECAVRLADYQQPMAFETMPSLPRSELGKLRRKALREQFRGYDATATLRRLAGG